MLTKGVGGEGPETVRFGSSEALSMCGTGLVSTAEWLEAATRTWEMGKQLGARGA